MNALTVDIEAKSFGPNKVLGAMRLELPEGQIATLLGPSGCGKSTLLSIIAGLDKDYSGNIHVDGDRVAMVFQAPRLLPWRTLAQNIALIPGSGGMERARQLLERVGLGASANQFPQKVSLGMQRRASLARALSVRPTVILMDEPLVSLDAETAADMRPADLRDTGRSRRHRAHRHPRPPRGASPLGPHHRARRPADWNSQRPALATRPHPPQGPGPGRSPPRRLVRRPGAIRQTAVRRKRPGNLSRLHVSARRLHTTRQWQQDAQTPHRAPLFIFPQVSRGRHCGAPLVRATNDAGGALASVRRTDKPGIDVPKFVVSHGEFRSHTARQ